jgi:hypothetical protein
MDIRKHWTAEVRITSRFNNAELYTDSSHLCHKESNLSSTEGMRNISQNDVDEEGIAPCSKCFPTQRVEYENLIGERCSDL